MINHWHSRCGMGEGLRAGLHRLRVWRNASLHHDAARWAREGPRSAEVALQHLAALQAMVETLEP